MTNVNHAIFEKGTVLNSDTKTIYVIFGTQVKRLMVKYANLTTEDGSAYIIPKVKKETTIKEDYSKYSDNELLELYSKLKSEFIGSIVDANTDSKSEGKKGFGFIN